jgi:amino acid transporter
MVMLLRRAVLGRPLPSSAQTQERLSNTAAIGAFGLDALSSVAYGPDEILYVLVLAGAAGLALDLPIAVAIAALLAIVAFSYRQTIYAYPQGGGSFTVASENLGRGAGLVAAAALMVDYLTTVAVSVTAGVEAIVALAPGLYHHRVLAGVLAILMLMLVNLRGVREAGALFIIPTYVFIGSLAALLLVGIVRELTGHAPAALHPVPAASEGLGVFLLLRAFAGGCTAMTGVEAIANGVPAFRRPESRNAARTLTVLALLLGALFLGVAGLGHRIDAVPSDQANVIAQIGQAMAPKSPLYDTVQVSAAIILLLAANTSFNGFPRLAAIMARDGYFPHQFSHRGLKLAYSNGIAAIGLLALVLVVVFRGDTHALIPLFAVGVFICFTLSQAGMVVHWLRRRGPRWRAKLLINGVGAVTTAAVTVIVASTKFAEGAWIVLLIIPLLVANFWAVHRHYRRAQEELRSPPPRVPHGRPRVVLPVRALNRASAAAIEYALSITDAERITAVHICAEDEDGEADDVEERWTTWAPGIHLELVPSPYREVITPLLDVIDRVQEESGGQVTVVLPEVLPHAWYEEPLHNHLAVTLKLALPYHPGTVVISVPVRLRQ